MPVTFAKYISINTKRNHDVFDGGIFPHNIIHPSCHEVHPRHIIKCRAGDDTNDYDATEDELKDCPYFKNSSSRPYPEELWCLGLIYDHNKFISDSNRYQCAFYSRLSASSFKLVDIKLFAKVLVIPEIWENV
jgi:hypothetical protein